MDSRKKKHILPLRERIKNHIPVEGEGYRTKNVNGNYTFICTEDNCQFMVYELRDIRSHRRVVHSPHSLRGKMSLKIPINTKTLKTKKVGDDYEFLCNMTGCDFKGWSIATFNRHRREEHPDDMQKSKRSGPVPGQTVPMKIKKKIPHVTTTYMTDWVGDVYTWFCLNTNCESSFQSHYMFRKHRREFHKVVVTPLHQRIRTHYPNKPSSTSLPKDGRKNLRKRSGPLLHRLHQACYQTNLSSTKERNKLQKTTGLSRINLRARIAFRRRHLVPTRRTSVFQLSPLQLTTLQTFFFTNSKPTTQEKQNLADETGLNYRYIKTWFADNRNRGLLRFEENNLNSDDIFTVTTTSRNPPNRILNTDIRIFSCDEDDPDVFNFQALNEDDDLDEMFQVYFVPWGKDEQTLGLFIGFTAMNDVRDAAEAHLQSILHDGEKACSSRYWYNFRGWRPENENARSFGVYARDENTARMLKWWFRLRSRHIATLGIPEVTIHFHPFARYLDGVVWEYENVFPDYNKKWLEFSAPFMNLHLADIDYLSPGINPDLMTHFDFHYRLTPDIIPDFQ